MPQYRELTKSELGVELFDHFDRTQVVGNCRRKQDGAWATVCDPSIEQWSQADYAYLVECLAGTLDGGGVVWGAFVGDELKGFASVDGARLGAAGQYMELTSLHVSSDMRHRGVGAVLFLLSADFARNLGVKKLYISAHPAVETQAFYQAMGCVDVFDKSMRANRDHASQSNQQGLVLRNPKDCPLEYEL